MALTDAQRGPRAAWLYHHRVAAYGRGDAALVALAADLRGRGAYRAPDTIKGWEASDERAPIPPDVLPHLEAVFGEQAPAPKRQVTAEDIVTALAEQTAAISALVEELRLSRAAQVEATDVAFQALGALGSGQAQRETPNGSEHAATSGTRP